MSLISLATAKEFTETRYPLEIAAAQRPPSPANQVAFQTIEKGFRSGARESLQIVIRGQAEWKDLWQRHAAIKTNPPPPPPVDFKSEIVVGVFLGEKPTGGHAIEIVSAERIDGTLLISFVEKIPPPGAMVTQAITQPFHIVRVAINGTGAVGFRRMS
ncbi:MAG: protease complex subunit PrcB family protein [Candidatus Binatia bacterium]